MRTPRGAASGASPVCADAVAFTGTPAGPGVHSAAAMAAEVPLSTADRARVRQAVERAERGTAGEIVPFVVGRSGRYEVAVWRGACLAAAVALAGTLLFLRLYGGWALAWLYDPWGPALVAAAAGALGGLATAHLPPLRRRLAGAARLDRAVRRRAARAFVEEEVFDTGERTGILLFVSVFERRIEVLADAGIHWRVGAGAWREVVELVRHGLADGRLADGLVAAIERCGELLDRAGVDAAPDDADELSDDVRVRRDD